MIEIGGETRAKGANAENKTWRIGISSPVSNKMMIHNIILLKNLSIATSGDYRNYFEKDGRRYSHTIDPRTGSPITHNLASVSVVHKTCMYADAFATAITVLGAEEGYKLASDLNLAAYFIIRHKDGFKTKMTEQFESLVSKK